MCYWPTYSLVSEINLKNKQRKKLLLFTTKLAGFVGSDVVFDKRLFEPGCSPVVM